MGILDQYKKQLEEDRKNENDNFSEDFNIEVDEDYKEQYKKELHKQRADIFDNEKQYPERTNHTLVSCTDDSPLSNVIKHEDVDLTLAVSSTHLSDTDPVSPLVCVRPLSPPKHQLTPKKYTIPHPLSTKHTDFDTS